MASDLKSHLAKQRAFNDMNEGKKRILIGSKTLFTGVNAQRRLGDIHNLDPLWYPADDEQRNGRGIRQGNMNPEIGIHDYSTKGTYDATMWQMMGRKASFIEGFYRGDPNMRDMEDLGEASTFEQAKALSTNDPRVLQLTELKAAHDKLRRRKSAIASQAAAARLGAGRARDLAQTYATRAAALSEIAKRVPDLSGDLFRMIVKGVEYDSRGEAGAALLEAAAALETVAGAPVIGEIAGFRIRGMWSKAMGRPDLYMEFGPGMDDVTIQPSEDAVGFARRVENMTKTPAAHLDHYQRLAIERKAQLADLEKQIAKEKPFADDDELARLAAQIRELQAAMQAGSGKNGPAEQRADSGVNFAPADARRVNRALADRLRDIGITIATEVREGSGRAFGDATESLIRLYRTDDGWRHTADHEAIHVLRRRGLIRPGEWEVLAKAAQADAALMEAVERQYGDHSKERQVEEAVAEMFADWRRENPPPGRLGRALQRIAAIFRALAGALRGEGHLDAAAAMERIASGEVGRRERSARQGDGATDDAVSMEAREQRDLSRFASASGLTDRARAARGWLGRGAWKPSPAVFSQWLTDAMGRDARLNLLGAVPGRALLTELAKNLPGAQRYLEAKTAMDAERNAWHARADETARAWHTVRMKHSRANGDMMDLMHDATLAGVDPSQGDGWRHPRADEAEAAKTKGPRARAWAAEIETEQAARRAEWEKLRLRFESLPADLQTMFNRVRDEYTALADEMDEALIENIDKAAGIALKQAGRDHRKAMAKIADDGLQGPERDAAIAEADAALDKRKARARQSTAARRASLRQAFESNRLAGPYFPLARFGRYFATVRDAEGKVVSFSRFESKADQDAFVAEQEAAGETVGRGVLEEASLKGQFDPRFVGEIEAILDGAGAPADVMDAVWQRWLESLPDRSVRKSHIHRKGRAGYSNDAYRAFAKQMFHGAHQLARLRHGLEMGEALNEASEQAAAAPDPERATFVVEEMRRRHEFVMNPTGNPIATSLTSLGFVWYLGMSPAAALVNLSQTTVIGVPMMLHRFKGAGWRGVTRALANATRDFGDGKGWAEKGSRLTEDDRAAMVEGYRRGTIDKTQGHDLAGVADSGTEYSPVREKVMRTIAFMFHHAERMNREVTFLANYRLARGDGQAHEAAIDTASDMTWKVHFSYQGSDRPRVMQGDVARVALLFRQYSVNMLWRLFRDAHQTFNGATREERAEARAQLIGISLSMFAHAGIKGVWGYGILMALLGLFFPGGGDDAEEWLQDALLMAGDAPGTAAWNWTMGMVLNGAPGHVSGTALTERIGMPNLWFRGSSRDLEGQDLFNHYTQELLGPIAGIASGAAHGAQLLAQGDLDRGIEKLVPGFVNDPLKAIRYAREGVVTRNGDVLVDDVGPADMLIAANGFTPARLAERYEINNRLKNQEKRITGERRDLHKAATDALRESEAIPAKTVDAIREFNRRFPEYPITAETIRASLRGRLRASERNEFGVSLNPKLNDRLRSERATPVYN